MKYKIFFIIFSLVAVFAAPSTFAQRRVAPLPLQPSAEAFDQMTPAQKAAFAKQLQNNPAQSEPTSLVPSSVVVATVNIYQAAIQKQQDRTVTASFQLSNRDSVQPNITYGVEVNKADTDPTKGVLPEVFVAPEMVSLGTDQIVNKTFTFTLPDYLSGGDYTVDVFANNASGLLLGFQSAGKITIKSQSVPLLNVSDCKLSIVGAADQKTYILDEGIDIAPSETLQLACQIQNPTSGVLEFSPQFTTYRRNIFSGVIVETTPVNSDSISLQANETKAVTIALPKAATPQAYDVKVTFIQTQTKQILGVSRAHYVLQGASGTLSNVIIDKSAYVAGDTALVTVTYSGAADGFVGSRLVSGGTAIGTFKIQATLTDESGTSCAEPLQKEIPSGLEIQQILAFTISRECAYPNIHTKLINADNNTTLDEVTALTRSASDKPKQAVALASNEEDQPADNLTQIKIVSGIVVVLLVISLIVLVTIRKRKNAQLLLLFLFLGFGFLAGEAKADTITLKSQICFFDSRGCSNKSHVAMVTFTYNLDKPVYTLGDSMNVSVVVTQPKCSNGAYINSSSAKVYLRETTALADPELEFGSADPVKSKSYPLVTPDFLGKHMARFDLLMNSRPFMYFPTGAATVYIPYFVKDIPSQNVPKPEFTFSINGSKNALIKAVKNTNLSLAWKDVKNAKTCMASDGWSGPKDIKGGTESKAYAGGDDVTFNLSCVGDGGMTSKSIVVQEAAGTVKNLTICKGSCNSGEQLVADSSLTMDTTLVACLNTDTLCNLDTNTGTSPHWTSTLPTTSLTLAPTNELETLASPQGIGGKGSITASVTGYTKTVAVIVPCREQCKPDGGVDPNNVCQGAIIQQTDTNSCGACPALAGLKNCNSNWSESAP